MEIRIITGTESDIRAWADRFKLHQSRAQDWRLHERYNHIPEARSRDVLSDLLWLPEEIGPEACLSIDKLHIVETDTVKTVWIAALNVEFILALLKRFKCPLFRILMGRPSPIYVSYEDNIQYLQKLGCSVVYEKDTADKIERAIGCRLICYDKEGNHNER